MSQIPQYDTPGRLAVRASRENGAVEETSDRDVTRRTHLAAERTWLAWWRSGIAAATAAVAVGGVVPDLVEGSRTPYVVLGAGYALLAAGVFAGAAIRRRQVDQALARGDYIGVGERGVLALTLVAMALALATLVVIIVEP
jgi:uncharacterized membrane protein YidH (DUF202 family)